MYYTDCSDSCLPNPDLVINGLYISGFDAAENFDALKKAKISHILSVCGGSPCYPKDFEYLTLQNITDSPCQDVISYFPQCINFIQKGMTEGTGVLVHCAAGVSRSATVVLAFLMQKEQIDHQTALQKLVLCRPSVHPNYGFRQQLDVWYHMNFSIEGFTKAHRYYRLRLAADEFKLNGSIPPNMKYATDPKDDKSSDVYACIQCLRRMFTEAEVLEHEKGGGFGLRCSLSEPVDCNAYFVLPISWMENINKSSGLISCPECHSIVGSFAWQEIECSCLSRLYPFFRIEKDKVVKSGNRIQSS